MTRYIIVQTERTALFGVFSSDATDKGGIEKAAIASLEIDVIHESGPLCLDDSVRKADGASSEALMVYSVPDDVPDFDESEVSADDVGGDGIFGDYRDWDVVGGLVKVETDEDEDEDEDGVSLLIVRTKTDNLESALKASVAEYLEELDEDEESDDGLYRPYLAANRTLNYDPHTQALHAVWEVFVTDSQVPCDYGTWILDELEIDPKDDGAKAIAEAIDLIRGCWDPEWDDSDSAVYEENSGYVEADEDGDALTRSDYSRRQNAARYAA